MNNNSLNEKIRTQNYYKLREYLNNKALHEFENITDGLIYSLAILVLNKKGWKRVNADQWMHSNHPGVVVYYPCRISK